MKYLQTRIFLGCNDTYRDLGIILDISGSMCTPYYQYGQCDVNGPWWCCGRDQDDQLIPCDDCDEPLCGNCIGNWQCENALENKGIENGKKVIQKIANIANFTTNGSHGAFMTFDGSPRVPDIRFDDIASVDQFNREVEAVAENCTGGTDIIQALNASISNIFDYPNGVRDNVEKVALIITDGVDTEPKDNDTYDRMGEKFKDQDITLIVIGVGQNINAGQLKRLVQSPSYFFPANNWDQLDDYLIKLISAVICKGNAY